MPECPGIHWIIMLAVKDYKQLIFGGLGRGFFLVVRFV